MVSRSTSYITEPHPSVPQSGGYFSGGRGGAGNYKRYEAQDLTPGPSATGPASRTKLSLPSMNRPAAPSSSSSSSGSASRAQPSGRGGAGNFLRMARAETEERVFQFDEEMARRRDNATPVYHIGRGGAANFVDESKIRPHRTGSASSSSEAESVASHHSGGSGSGGSSREAQVRRSAESALGRLRGKFTTTTSTAA